MQNKSFRMVNDMDEATTDLTQCLICDWHIENDKLRERIKELENLLEQLVWIAKKAPTDDSEDTTIELAKQTLKG